jgi:hypothetical protein
VDAVFEAPDVMLCLDGGIANVGWSIMDPKTCRVPDLGLWTSSPTTAEGVAKSTDRARRIGGGRDSLSDLLVELVQRHNVSVIAAEEMLFHGKLNAVISQLLPWGAILGIAAALDLAVYSVPAKSWQPAMLGRKVSYEVLELELGKFIMGQAEAKLLSIPASLRTHPLDSVGVGLYAKFCKPPRVRSRRGKAV